jgi:hypothetical protein
MRSSAYAPAEELRNLPQRLPEWNLDPSEGQQCASDFIANLLRMDGQVAEERELTLGTLLNTAERARLPQRIRPLPRAEHAWQVSSNHTRQTSARAPTSQGHEWPMSFIQPAAAACHLQHQGEVEEVALQVQVSSACRLCRRMPGARVVQAVPLEI